MKKKIFLFYSILSVLLTACSSNNEVTDVNLISENKSEALEFDKLCSDLDVIGSKYYSPTTRSVNWTKWGHRFFSATVDGITGYIAGPAGVIVGTLSSWAFEEHWDHCVNRMRAATLRRVNSYSNHTYVFNDGTLEKCDSIGYYHNMMLDYLANSGKDYTTVDGETDYIAILDDCILAASKYGVDLSISPTDKLKYANFSKEVVLSFSDCYNQKIAIEEAYGNICISYENKFNIKLNYDKVEIVQRKIADVLNCIDNESSIIEYANQVNAIIRDTSVNPELKSDLKTVTDITINSKLYWDAVQ